jgi:hypothetical protein
MSRDSAVSRRNWGLAGAGIALAAWAVDFTALYALASFACERPGLVWLVTAVCGLAALGVLATALRAPGTRTDDPSDRVGPPLGAVTALLALIAIAWQAVAALSVPPCR